MPPILRKNRTADHTGGKEKPAALDGLLAKLQKVSQTSNGWQACCPGHDDTHPSLSIGIGDRGRILLHCHAGCSFDDLASALDMRPADLAPGNTARPIPLKKKTLALAPKQSLKSLSALDNQKNEPGRNGVLKSLSALDEDNLLLSVAKRAGAKMIADTGRPSPFPIHVFPKALQDFIKKSAESLPCPVDFIGLPVLAVASSFIGAGRPMQIKKGWQERPIIYGMTVGSTGTRKSPALEKAMAPATKRDRELAAKYKAARREYENKRRQAKANKTDFNEPEPVEQQHVTTDTTVEALADVLGWNPRGVLVYRDEATGWVASLNQYKGGKGSDRQFWLSAWSCQDYTVNRKGKPPLRIIRPFLSVIGNLPPDMLGELADRRGREDGFIDRILFAYPDPVQVKWTDSTVNPKLEGKYVNACLGIGRLPDAVLTLTAQARAEFSLWYDEHNREHDGPAGSWAKMDGYCARLANILHHLYLAYGDKQELESLSALEVGVERVRGAIALTDYFKNHARRALGCMKAGKEGRVLARLLAFVVNAPDHRMRPRTLIGAQIAANAKEAKAMLEKLASMGLGEMVAGNRKDEIIFQGREDLEEVVGNFEQVESS
jgi:hypothetical protein